MDLPLLEFDAGGVGMYAPSAPRLSEPWPERAVLCYFHEQIAALHERGAARLAGRFSVEMGGHGIYVTEDSKGRSVAVFHPTVGAPSAVHHLERAMAAGVREVVLCGGAGALVSLAVGHVVVPNASLRDEGTSFHYAPPSPSIEVDGDVVETLTNLLVEQEVPHAVGMAWTTDGLFRETPAKVAARRDQGCLVVDMEASAVLAAARFRGARLGLMLYAGDDLSGQAWDKRNWTASEARARLLPLAIEAVGRL
jgi:uridine phosphorylase